MSYLIAFLVGGALCLAAQLVLDLGRLTAAHVMVIFVVAGALAGGLGLYGPLVRFAGAGASVPVSGFGYALVQGVLQDVHRSGFLGIFTGGLKATAAGIKAAVIFGYLAALLSRPRN